MSKIKDFVEEYQIVLWIACLMCCTLSTVYVCLRTDTSKDSIQCATLEDVNKVSRSIIADIENDVINSIHEMWWEIQKFRYSLKPELFYNDEEKKKQQICESILNEMNNKDESKQTD